MYEPKYAVGETRPPLKSAPETAGAGLPDAVFAAVFLVLGWLFWDLQLWVDVFPFGFAAGAAVFTLLYAAAVLAYLFAAGRTPAAESWFWLAVMLLLGLSYLLPYGGQLLGGAQYLALLAAASYWPLAACGRLGGAGRTSNWLFFDLMNAFLIAPWGNFARLFVVPLGVLRARRRTPDPARRKTAWAVCGGVLAAALCLCAVLPALMRADDGFAAVFAGFFDALDRMLGANFLEFCLKLVLALPTACYLYGLVYGAVRGRRLTLFVKRDLCAAQAGLRFLPHVTVAIALGALGAVYALFIAMQARYLFGGFFGVLPAGFTYAEYARQGFFELCEVASLNAALLIAANVLHTGGGRGLRLYNGAVASLTLLLLATAAAKMALYIGAYGLTEKRVLACAGLLWLALVFACVLARQFRPVPLVRAAVLAGAVLTVLLCCWPVADSVRRYNETHGAGAAPAAVRMEPDGALPYSAATEREEGGLL